MGPLVMVGGGEDRRGPRRILREIARLAGGQDGTLAVIGTASAAPEEAADAYCRVFTELGVGRVQPVMVDDRGHAQDPRRWSLLPSATGVFFTGGDQLRITAVLGGTALEQAIRDAVARGAVAAGTSAGAAVMSATMIVEGPGERSLRREILRMCPGLGLWPEVVVDQHFAQRGRMNRLLSVVAHNPRLLGVGIDEDTAVVVHPGRRFRVLGSGTVTVVDGRRSFLTTASEARVDEPLTLLGVTVHVLAEGYGWDLARDMPLAPEQGAG